MTDAMRGPNCLSAEMLAAYVDGRLGVDERATVEAHLADCDLCREAAAEAGSLAAELAAALGPSKVTPLVSRRTSRTVWVAGAIAAVLVAALALPLLLNRAGGRPELRALVSAAGATRSVEGRLSGGFAWAPPPSADRGLSGSALSPDVRIAIANIDNDLARDRSARNLGAAGTARVIAGDLTGAIGALEEATSLDARSAFLRADLATAYLARASQPGREADLAAALDAVNSAIAMDDRLAEGWFTKALILERLNLGTQAQSAWDRFLALDGTSQWADEARRHLATLRGQRSGSRDLQQRRERFFDEALPAWATAAVAHRPDAPALLAAATALASEGTVADRDLLARDALSAATAAASGTSRFAAMSAGLEAYAAARAAYKRDAFEEALPLFQKATRDLTASQSPVSLLATLHEGVIAYRGKDMARADDLLSGVRRAVGSRAYPALLGRLDWTAGLILVVTGKAEASLAAYRRAATALADAGELQNAAFVEGLMATAYDKLGDPVRSWHSRVQALRGTSREGSLQRAALEAKRSGWLRAALEFEEAAGATARNAKRDTTVVDSLRSQAITLGQLGEPAASAARLAEARALLQGRTGAAWDRLAAEVDLAQARAARATDATAGIAAADRALRYFETTKPPTEDRLPEILVARARLSRLAGHADDARADLDRARTVVIDIRNRLGNSIDLATFSDTARQVAGETIAVALATGTPDQGFAAVDDLRAADLRRGPDARAALTPSSIQHALPAHTVLLEFVTSADQSALWIVGQGAASVVRIDLGEAALRQLIDAALPPRDDEAARRRLGDVLLSAVWSAVQPGDLVVIVPDGPLHALPFAALPGRQARYLIEEHPVLVAPSARAFVDAASHDRANADRSLFAVGNPSFDAASFPDLQTLPFADAEVASILPLYQPAVALTGAQATHDALLRELPRHDVFHFAGHAVVNLISPDESALVLAGGPDERLRAADIRSLPLSRVSLVVLGACESAAGFRTRTEGPLGLSRAFLVAGVPTVIASLWNVNDAATAALLSRFHQEFQRTGDAARSLQTAQVEQLKADQRLATWAAFVVIGVSGGTTQGVAQARANGSR